MQIVHGMNVICRSTTGKEISIERKEQLCHLSVVDEMRSLPLPSLAEARSVLLEEIRKQFVACWLEILQKQFFTTSI